MAFTSIALASVITSDYVGAVPSEFLLQIFGGGDSAKAIVVGF